MKTALLLVFGGESSEHDVSLKSARNVFGALDADRYDISLCYISRDGSSWLLVPSFDELAGDPLLPILGKGAFSVGEETLKIDVILPILHGKHGEDGAVQGLASLLHIPCVGPSVIGAAVTMDKDLTKHVLREGGVPVVEWQTWHVGEPMPGFADLTATLGPTLFVKPSNAGSSVGVSKVVSAGELETALSLAGSHDLVVLIERAITGREIELAVLGNESLKIATPGEILPDSDFYSYDAKYAASYTAHDEIPAKLNLGVAEQLRTYAETAYRLVRGHGMARVDFFVTDANEIYLNEINSIPGFTDISMYPKMWQHDGLSYPMLLDELIGLALESRN